MTQAYGPQFLLDKRTAIFNKCIRLINNIIETEEGPVVKIEISLDLHIGNIYKEVSDLIINSYVRAGWNKVYYKQYNILGYIEELLILEK